MQRLKQNFSEILLALTIFLPAFFQGGRTPLGVLLMSIAAAAYALVAYRAGWFKETQTTPLFFFYGVLSAFGMWVVVNSLFYASDAHTAVKTALPFIIGSLLFMMIAGMRRERKDAVSLMLLAGAALFVFIGIIFFIQSQNFGYLRLISTFYHHNGFAGFLLPFLPLSLWVMHERHAAWGRIFPFMAPIILFTGFLLTFSRGGYISAIVSILIYFFLLWRVEGGWPFVRQAGGIFIILVISGMFTYGLFALKEVQSARANVSEISPYPTGANNESSFSARVEYMKIGGTLFAARPFAGYGLGSFGTFARTVQTDVRFFSTDPHNLYLRFFVELGYFGGILFLVFVGRVLISGIKYIALHRHDMGYAALYSGMVGMFVHNGGDFDFQFPAIAVLFFCIAGMLVSQGSFANISAEKKRIQPHFSEPPFSSRLPALLALLSIAGAFIISVAAVSYFFVSAQKGEHAQAALLVGDIARAGDEYEEALRFDPWDAQLRRDAAHAYLAAGNMEKAFNEFARAVQLSPYDRTSYLMLADLLQKQNRTEEAIRLYEGALALAPYKDLQAVFGLMNTYRSIGGKGEAIKVAKEALVRFPKEAFDSPLWIDPNKEQIRVERRALEEGIETLKASK